MSDLLLAARILDLQLFSIAAAPEILIADPSSRREADDSQLL
jgi:hypothetical protein